MSKNYWNYCDSEKTIADSIDIATFLSMQKHCLGYYCDISIVRCFVTSLIQGASKVPLRDSPTVYKMSRETRFPTMWHVRPAKP